MNHCFTLESPVTLTEATMSSQAPGHQAPSSEPSAATRQPLLNTTAPAINAAPIELDSTPVSPVAKQHSWPRGGAPAGAPAREGSAGALSPQEKEVSLHSGYPEDGTVWSRGLGVSLG